MASTKRVIIGSEINDSRHLELDLFAGSGQVTIPISFYNNLGVTPFDANGNLKVNIAAGGAGNGAILDFTNNAIGATVSASGALKVDGSAVTQPISGTVTVTATNLSTNVAQINGITPLMGNGGTGTGSLRVTVASDNTAFAVNATLSAETTKVIGTINIASAQTLATVTTVSTVTNLAQMNGAVLLMGNGTTGTGSQRVTIASDNTPFPIKVDQTTPGTTNAISLAQIGATTVVTGGVNGTLAVGGNVATNVAIGTNPINLGAQAVSAENTAVTTTRMVQLVADLVGKLIVLPYSNPENFVSGLTSAMTGTTSTSLIAAPASGLRNYVTHIIATNSHATVGTFVIIQDGSGGTTLYEGFCGPAGGGFSITFPVPLRQPTTATAIYCQDVTTGANVIVSASGYKGA